MPTTTQNYQNGVNRLWLRNLSDRYSADHGYVGADAIGHVRDLFLSAFIHIHAYVFEPPAFSTAQELFEYAQGLGWTVPPWFAAKLKRLLKEHPSSIGNRTVP